MVQREALLIFNNAGDWDVAEQEKAKLADIPDSEADVIVDKFFCKTRGITVRRQRVLQLVLCRCASEQAHVDEDLRDSGLSGGGAGAGSDRTLCEKNRKGEGNRAKVRGKWVRGTYVPGTSLRYWVSALTAEQNPSVVFRGF